MARREKVKAVAYLRTSSATNVGADKDSDKRQRATIASFAKAHGYTIAAEFYDAAVSGADPVDQRPGFKDMLALIAGNGVRVILVESPDRFARDITVQEVGHRMLKALGVCLIPTTAPDHFTTDTPTSKMIRQVLGVVAEFEKANLVAKLKAARDRKIAAGEKCGGRKSHSEARPEVVELAKQLRRKRPKAGERSLREISRELAKRGHFNHRGKPFAPMSVRNMLAQAG
jgi:DNA invertase Pin-like site-specific DNA recombinase